MTCLICNQREANATGSHIISHLVLEDMANGGAVKGRDKEQLFSVTGAGSQAFFGRQVLPETIEQTMGRGLDETDAAQNFYVADHIFCTVCETRLGVLESVYKQKVVPALSRAQALTESQYQLAYVFWLSTIYRCAVTQFDDYALPADQQAVLGSLVNQLLADTAAQTELNSRQIAEEALRLGSLNLLVGYLPTAEDNSNNVVHLPRQGEISRLLAINHYILLFNYTSAQVDGLEQTVGVGFSINQPGLSLRFFTLAERSEVLAYFHGLSAERFWAARQQIFVQAYQQRLHRLPSEAEWRAYQQAVVSGDELPTVKYSEQRMQRVLEEHLRTAR